MKNRLLTTAACLLVVLTGQAQMSESAQRIHEKIEAFVAAGEYNVSEGVVINSDGWDWSIRRRGNALMRWCSSGRTTGRGPFTISWASRRISGSP